MDSSVQRNDSLTEIPETPNVSSRFDDLISANKQIDIESYELVDAEDNEVDAEDNEVDDLQENVSQQDVIIDELDESNFKAISTWLVNNVGILPSLDKVYCAKLFDCGIASVHRLGKKVSRDPTFLHHLEFKPDDVIEITEMLKKEGYLDDATADNKIPYKGSDETKETFFNINNLSSDDTHAQGNSNTANQVTGYISIENSSTSLISRKKNLKMRSENTDKFKEILTEAINLTENLRTAVEGKMELAVVGVLHSIALFVEHSFDKQKAMFRANIAIVVTTALRELGASIPVCEQVMIVVALLCRHSDDNKLSISYENAKAFGLSGICEYVTAALVKYADEIRIVETALDTIRCLCYLDSNRTRFSATIACETVGRCLSTFINNPDLCCWIARTIGHLSNNNDDNRELIGSVGSCEHIIMIMQKYQHNLNLCIELCWAIRNLAPIYNNRARFANEHGPECIAAIYKFHYGSELFAIEACRALVSLIASEDDDIIPRIAVSGIIPIIFKSFKRFGQDSEVFVTCMFNLMYYISCDVRLIPRLLSCDILTVLSVSFDNHAVYEPLAEWGLRTVSKLSHASGILAKMRNAGLCEVTISTVQRQAISSTVSGHGCLAIGELAIDPANHDRLSTAGASEALIGALKRHDSSIDVVINAGYAIHFLCGTENISSWMGANGVCEAITKALVKHIDTSIEVTRSTTRAIGSLASFHDDGNISRLSACEVATAIVKALKTYANDPEVAEYTCRAVYNLCYDSSSLKEFGRQGACGWVVGVLQTHANNANVISQACLAIHGLAVKLKVDKVHVGNTRKLVEKGAIEVVIAVMQKYPTHAEVQSSCALAISSLGRSEVNRNTLGAINACELIITAATIHATNGSVIGKLGIAVEVLSNNCDTNRNKFADSNLIDCLYKTLTKFEKNPLILSECIRGLIAMLAHESSKPYIRSEAYCRQVVKVLRLHGEKDINLAKWGCSFVYSSATDDAVRARLGSLKTCEVVSQVLSRLGEASAEVAAWGCKAMFALAVYDPNKTKFANHESCNALVKSMKEHHDNSVVAEWGCAAMVSIASSDTNRSRLGGGCQALQLILSKQSHSEDITRLACEAIYELAYQDQANKTLFAVHGTCEQLVTTFSIHIKSEAVLQQLCRAITALAKSNPENANKFNASGLFEWIVTALTNHYFSVALAEWICSAISALTEKGNSSNQTKFAELKVSTHLMNILRAHRSNELVIAQACRSIRSLCANKHDENTKQFANLGIIGTALGCLKAHAASTYVSENCGWILANLPTSSYLGNVTAADDSNAGSKDLYKSVAAWDLLCSVLQTHVQKDTTARWITSAIQVFAERGQLSHVPMCDTVLTCFSLHLDKEKVLGQLLVTVGALGSNHVENGLRLMKGRICETIDAIFTKYSNLITQTQQDVELVYSSCYRAIYGLVALTPTPGSTIIQYNQPILDRFSSIQTFSKNILRSSYSDLESDSVSKWACVGIAALTHKHKILQYKLGPAGNFLVDILSYHRQSVDIATQVCKSVVRLSHTNITNRNRFGSSGICDELPKVMSIFLNSVSSYISPVAANAVGSTAAASRGGSVISTTFLSSSISSSISSKGSKLGPVEEVGTPLVSSLADELSDLLEVLIWQVRAIAELAANHPNNQTKLGASGTCEALVSTLNHAISIADDLTGRRDLTMSHVEKALDLIKWTCWAIGNLVQSNKSEQTGQIASHESVDNSTPVAGITSLPTAAAKGIGHIGQVGVGQLKALGGVMRNNLANIPGANNISGVVSSSFNFAKNTTRFGAAGVVDCLLTVLNNHSSNTDIMIWCCRAVNNLSMSRTLKQRFLKSSVLSSMDLVVAAHGDSADLTASVDESRRNEVLYWSRLAISSVMTGDGSTVVSSPDKSQNSNNNLTKL